jgi:hypothetical protein
VKKYLRKCLKGEEKLWKVFWLFNIFGGSIISVIGTLAMFQFLIAPIMEVTINDQELSSLIKYIPGILIGTAVVLFCIWFDIVTLISLWKCSWNSKNRIWGYLARGFIIVSFIFVFFESRFG